MTCDCWCGCDLVAEPDVDICPACIDGDHAELEENGGFDAARFDI